VAVKNWHVGKLVLLWVWGIVLTVVVAEALRHIDNPMLGFPLIAAIVFMPLVLSVLTWRWLGGKESEIAKSGNTEIRP
jgi:hypothetical protein